MSRTFRVCDGRTVTLPQSLQSGPGRTNMRCPPGSIVTLDDDACVREQRFVNGRIRAEDWIEVDPKDAPADAPEPVLVKHFEQRDIPNAEFRLELHGDTKEQP